MKCCKSKKASSLLNSWGIHFNHWNRIFSVSLANLTFLCFSPRGFDVLLRMKSITVRTQFLRDLVVDRSHEDAKEVFHSVFQVKSLSLSLSYLLWLFLVFSLRNFWQIKNIKLTFCATYFLNALYEGKKLFLKNLDNLSCVHIWWHRFVLSDITFESLLSEFPGCLSFLYFSPKCRFLNFD